MATLPNVTPEIHDGAGPRATVWVFEISKRRAEAGDGARLANAGAQVRLIAAVLSSVALAGAAQGPKFDDVIARLERYVAGYEAELANVVAEETYRQTVFQSARDSQTRTLRSDYALTPAADRKVWVGYRDTFEVDGLPVRDREARLQRLLAGGAFAQAQRITEQNARFNLGSDLLPRTINVPTFALELLQPRYRDRFSRRRKGVDSVDGRTGWLVEFRERDRPTIVRTPEGRDQPSRLLVLVDASNGQVLRTTVTWERVDGSVTVIYGSVSAIPVLVPVRMSERYTTRNRAQIEAEAEYSNYRQFQTSGRVISP